jgi:hypothetical protein
VVDSRTAAAPGALPRTAPVSIVPEDPMKTLQLDASALEVRTFDVEPRPQPEPEPPQQVKTRCTACTQPTVCQWTA